MLVLDALHEAAALSCAKSCRHEPAPGIVCHELLQELLPASACYERQSAMGYSGSCHRELH